MATIRIYALITDAYGGHGGVAVFNRDLLAAFAQHPRVSQVIAVPRVISRPMEPVAPRVLYRTEAARGALAFLGVVARDISLIARSDIIYCGHMNLAPLAWLLGRLVGRPVLGALYGIEAWSPSRRKAMSIAARSLDQYYAISSYTRERFSAWSGVPQERIALLPNAIHLENYGLGPKPDALIARLGLRDRRVLLTFGRLVSRERAKGFDEVLAVLPSLIRDYPNIAYVIAGEGDYRASLEAEVKRLGLVNYVTFTGFVEESEKADLYRLADLYVMPSRGEGFGFVFLEAMACGIPVVASAADGSRDAVRDGMLGAIVDPGDPVALLEAIHNGLRRPKQVSIGLAYFSFPCFVKRVTAIIDHLTLR